MRVAAIAGAVLVVIVGMWLAKRQQQAHAAQAEPPNS
jgi:phosphate starvation-inducible membrane PsiE